jgi:hypothetical protein
MDHRRRWVCVGMVAGGRDTSVRGQAEQTRRLRVELCLGAKRLRARSQQSAGVGPNRSVVHNPKLGQFGTQPGSRSVRLLMGSKYGIMLAPAEAILHDYQSAFVWGDQGRSNAEPASCAARIGRKTRRRDSERLVARLP